MSDRRVEMVASTKSVGKALYAYNFLKKREVPFRMYFPSSVDGKALRVLFDEKDDGKVYPLIVVSERLFVGEKGTLVEQHRVIFQAPQAGVAKLYKAIRKYLHGDEAE